MIALEQLADGSISDRNFQRLTQLVVDTGGRSVGVRFGTGVWTWAGGVVKSNVTVINHGLGRTPIAVFVCGSQANGLQETAAGEAFTYTSTQFSTWVSLSQGLVPGAGATCTFVWLVIG